VRIYLDHNASGPLRPEARAAMTAALDLSGNPSSAHREGAAVRTLVERARADVAALIGAAPAEIVFTSGATEANNLALRGTVAARPGAIVTSAVEHASVLETARALDVPLRIVAVDADGRGRPTTWRGVRAGTTLVTIGLANGEVGAIAPVADVPRVARRALVHRRSRPQGAPDRRPHARRHPLALRPQARRPERIGALRDPVGRGARADRGPGTRAACRHGERRRHRALAPPLRARGADVARAAWPSCAIACGPVSAPRCPTSC
jgi:hypothetical protein